ncbi:GPI-GlcNAc transferase complex, PIG-H component-domain-containing protein [Microdochium bolleyi]|uniref:GPI-GlcNAc transferase complex, PIG-H component-domain-containing protein n=1 Tax=Microdochium bolleyi TaxID=196109 RepID=A0A136JHJ8_9PEZI|nr:GPI-GlcNAc transferase complex, PIG-H component-domain-containing protein [Microdochium bolleyi]
MLTTRPYLRTRRPSPTTVEFIVTTRPALTTPLRVLLYSVYSLRVLLGLGIVLVLFATWDVSPFSTTTTAGDSSSFTRLGYPTKMATRPSVFSEEFVWYTIYHVLHSTAAGRAARDLAVAAVGIISPAAAAAATSSTATTTTTTMTTTALLPWLALPPVYLLALYYLVLRRIHTEERLLVLRGLGIQTSSSAATVLGSSVTRFIPTEKIQDVLINEAFRGFEVRHYLIVIVEGEEDVVVVFPQLLPRPEVVEKVWRGLRRCLYEQQQQNGGRWGIGGAGTKRLSGTGSPEKEGSPVKGR